MLPLLGILGAGLASQALVQGYGKPWAERQQAKARGRMFADVFSSLPDDASADDKIQALAMGGLLDPRAYAQYGFQDWNSSRDFLEQLRAQQNQYNLADRNNARSQDRAFGYDVQMADINAANTAVRDARQQEYGVDNTLLEYSLRSQEQQAQWERELLLAEQEGRADAVRSANEAAAAVEDAFVEKYTSGNDAIIEQSATRLFTLGEELRQLGGIFNPGRTNRAENPQVRALELAIRQEQTRLNEAMIRKWRQSTAEPSDEAYRRLLESIPQLTDVRGVILNGTQVAAAMEGLRGIQEQIAEERAAAQLESYRRINEIYRRNGLPQPYEVPDRSYPQIVDDSNVIKD